jgi:hypothetical protein
MIVLHLVPDADPVRERCMLLSGAKCLCGLALASCFWAAFGWVVIFVGLCVVTGLVGMIHLRSMSAVHSSDCCCSAGSALTNLHHVGLVNIVVGITSSVSSLLAVFYYSGVTKRFASASLALCMVLTLLEISFVWSIALLRQLATVENGAVPPRHVQVAPETVGYFHQQETIVPQQPPYLTGGGYYASTLVTNPPMYGHEDVVVGVPVQASSDAQYAQQEYPPPAYPQGSQQSVFYQPAYPQQQFTPYMAQTNQTAIGYSQ